MIEFRGVKFGLYFSMDAMDTSYVFVYNVTHYADNGKVVPILGSMLEYGKEGISSKQCGEIEDDIIRIIDKLS